MNKQLYIQTEQGLVPYTEQNKYWHIAAAALVLVLIAVALGVKAYANNSIAGQPNETVVEANSALAMLGDITGNIDSKFDQERKGLDSAKKQALTELALLTRRVAAAQARLTHLELTAMNLSEKAGIHNSEVDFTPAKPIGGPVSVNENADIAAEAMDAFYKVTNLEQQLEQRSRQLEALRNLIIHDSWMAEAVPKGRPVKTGYPSSAFGVRKDPFSGKKTKHKGMDFAARAGTDIIAVADGVVTWSGRRSGYGLLVEVSHGNGYVTRYAHNQENKVQVGDEVSAGQVIALVGSSGRSTGPHLHFEVWHQGRVINPNKFVAKRR